MKSFPFEKQLDAMDCGPACLKMIAQHYGKHLLSSDDSKSSDDGIKNTTIIFSRMVRNI